MQNGHGHNNRVELRFELQAQCRHRSFPSNACRTVTGAGPSASRPLIGPCALLLPHRSPPSGQVCWTMFHLPWNLASRPSVRLCRKLDAPFLSCLVWLVNQVKFFGLSQRISCKARQSRAGQLESLVKLKLKPSRPGPLILGLTFAVSLLAAARAHPKPSTSTPSFSHLIPRTTTTNLRTAPFQPALRCALSILIVLPPSPSLSSAAFPILFSNSHLLRPRAPRHHRHPSSIHPSRCTTFLTLILHTLCLSPSLPSSLPLSSSPAHHYLVLIDSYALLLLLRKLSVRSGCERFSPFHI